MEVDKEKLLHALIIEDSANDAELLANLLRNAGYAVRAVNAEDEEELQSVLKEHNLDVVFCSMESEEPSLQQTHQAISAGGRDITLLATTASGADLQLQTAAMKLGAADLIDRDDQERLQLVMNREIGNLEKRRELRRCENVMRESEKRCHALLDSSRDAITYVHDGMHVYANPVYLDTFGFTDIEDIEGMPVMDMVAPEDHGKFKDFLRRHGKNQKEVQQLEVMGMRADGGTFNAMMEFSRASIEGEPCTQIIIRNQSINKELEKKLKYLSKLDLLTGLYNRQYFLEELERAISDAAATTTGSAVLYIEPDNFKTIKDTVGIAGGDLVLSDIANLLQAEIDGSDAIAARFGDNTFAVLLHDQDPQAAEILAERIRSAVENHIAEVGDTSVTATCSIGIGLVGETSQGAQEVLSHADVACEVAAKNGGNRIHLHNPVADEQAGLERDQQWLQLIREAIEHDRFRLVYQPIASLHGETSERYEVLVRMRDSEGKEILPGQFIPVAEKHGLIREIDRWVIGRAIRVLSERRRSGRDTTFFLKISGASLDDDTLLPWLSEQITSSRLEGDSLVFEVSEAAAVTNLKSARQFAKGLQELRCRFSLDHFGNGMNSFQLLKHLPADFLKIDGSFMHNLATDQEQQAMVKSITDMAHSMGKTTIAEFVEDASSLAVLWQCGVNYIQGHFLQAPDEAMEFDFQGEEA
jgi:diguanylate cyclase (GGDEF)-like protein/PAS domain S-box-containing protein